MSNEGKGGTPFSDRPTIQHGTVQITQESFLKDFVVLPPSKGRCGGREFQFVRSKPFWVWGVERMRRRGVAFKMKGRVTDRSGIKEQFLGRMKKDRESERTGKENTGTHGQAKKKKMRKVCRRWRPKPEAALTTSLLSRGKRGKGRDSVQLSGRRKGRLKSKGLPVLGGRNDRDMGRGEVR